MDGDEEILELERMAMMHYERDVLSGLEYEITVILPQRTIRASVQGVGDAIESSVAPRAMALAMNVYVTCFIDWILILIVICLL